MVVSRALHTGNMIKKCFRCFYKASTSWLFVKAASPFAGFHVRLKKGRGTHTKATKRRDALTNGRVAVLKQELKHFCSFIFPNTHSHSGFT